MTTVERSTPTDRQAEAAKFVHISATCCAPHTRSLCGRSLTGMRLTDAEAECVVCAAMEEAAKHCERCGWPTR